MLNAVVGVAGLIVVSLLGYVCSKRIMFGWWAFLVASAINAFFGESQANVAGLHLDPLDFVDFVLLIAGLLRFFRRGWEPGRMRIVSALFLAIYAFSAIRGVAANGALSVGVETRQYTSEILATLFFFTFPADEETMRRVVKAYLWYGGALIICAILHYAGLQVGDPASFVDTEERDRALSSAGAASLEICLLFSLAWGIYRKSSWYVRLMPVMCAGFVILLQHRTVWNMLLACLLMSLVIDFKLLRRIAPAAVIAGGLALLIGLGIYGSSATAVDTLQDSATNSGTWEFRVAQWDGLVSDRSVTMTELLFGRPIGDKYSIYMGPRIGFSEIPIHSEYLSLYFRMGIVGSALFTIFMFYPLVMLFRQARSSPRDAFPSSSAWVLVVLSLIIYGVTYQIHSSIGVLLGFANALVLKPSGFLSKRG